MILNWPFLDIGFSIILHITAQMLFLIEIVQKVDRLIHFLMHALLVIIRARVHQAHLSLCIVLLVCVTFFLAIRATKMCLLCVLAISRNIDCLNFSTVLCCDASKWVGRHWD